MKHSNFGHKLVFGLLGGTYTVVGGVFLTLAITKTSGVQEIFSHPEEEIVVFATLGTVFLLLGIAFLIVTLLLEWMPSSAESMVSSPPPIRMPVSAFRPFILVPVSSAAV